jgi:hypothetical protein
MNLENPAVTDTPQLSLLQCCTFRSIKLCSLCRFSSAHGLGPSYATPTCLSFNDFSLQPQPLPGVAATGTVPLPEWHQSLTIIGWPAAVCIMPGVGIMLRNATVSRLNMQSSPAVH